MTVDLSFAGLPGNQPKSYGNFVALWDSSIVSWTVPPLGKDTVATNQTAGTHVLNGVSISRVTYTLTYSVGPGVTDICASALLNGDGSSGATDAVLMEVKSVGSTSLTVHYHTLGGYLPAKSGNWMGLWAGRVSPYNAPAALATTHIAADVSDGDIGINGITLERGQFYTLVYFMGEQKTTAAVLVTFQVPS